jgi:hypothetical protein
METLMNAGAGETTKRGKTSAGPPEGVITRTTITPAPGSGSAPAQAATRRQLRDDAPKPKRDELTSAKEPFKGPDVMRVVITTLLGALTMFTVGGAILMLLLWQQNRDAGVLTAQLNRTWDLFETLRKIERIVAFCVIPVAVAWIALATINVRRATGLRRNAVVAAGSLPAALFGIWIVGSQVVAESGDWVGKSAGVALQGVLATIPLLAIERVAEAAESRRQPLRATFLISIAYLALLQGLGALSTIDKTTDAERWGHLGAYLVIGALIQALGALSANEAMRALQVGTEHRYMLRHKFGESLLNQVVGH